MADLFTKKDRSRIMSSITGIETKPEILVRKFLFKNGLRYRKNVKRLPGKPDIVLSKYKAVIFVHGCFWHGHAHCPKASLPTTNKNFWKKKITQNTFRDLKNVNELIKLGWRIIIVWQCELKNKTLSYSRLKELVAQLKQQP